MNDELAEVLFPDIKNSKEYYESKYPSRNLEEKAIVTRSAPSPTGFVHLGNIYQSFLVSRFAKQTKGVCFLRIEDTDQKREVENGIEKIIKDLNSFDINFDEYPKNENEEIGSYGPYIQSKRKEIYQTFAKYFVEKGLAYPCFCSQEDLENIRKVQEEKKERIGYYGKWAVCRQIKTEDAIKRIKSGDKWVLRLKSNGSFNNKVDINDLIKGNLELPENDMDIVIIKSDGLPTYHFAHLVDDYLMHSTHIIRADEWLSSLPLHTQLFNMLGVKPPKYAHISPLSKIEGTSRRKLSKRKDPEFAASFYDEKGIPKEALRIYLLTIANSNFEAWYNSNPNKDINEFELTFNKMSSSDILFDLEKLINISRNYISRLKSEKVYEEAYKWAEKYDNEYKDLLDKYKEYSIKIFNVEREKAKPRKDYDYYSHIKEQTWYMYDELFNTRDKDYEFNTISDTNEIKLILNTYINKYFDITNDQIWFDKVKDLSEDLGYAREVKDYKDNPDKYKGHVGDISMVLRVALTTKSMTPNLYDIFNLLGKEKVLERFNLLINK
ncbi:MAG TPA: glutamate--tRNA ligase family protein [Bacilli bacterium]|nr:glutamate--tRNA ligase family protein [Bacilli bacterium]